MEEFKKGDVVLYDSMDFVYNRKSSLGEGLVVIEDIEGDFFHVPESEIKHREEPTYEFYVNGEKVDVDSVSVNIEYWSDKVWEADKKEKEIDESDRRAFAFAVLSRAKKGANHWHRNLGYLTVDV